MARKSYRRKAAAAEQPSSAGAGDTGTRTVDPNVALFASRMKQEKARDRAAKRAAQAERKAAEEHQRLIDAKESAAADLKRLRREGGAGAVKVAEADAAYRSALAALITHETGEAPAWAPAAPPAPDTDAGEGPAPDAEAAAEAATDDEDAASPAHDEA